jgi:tetratricopeptide (TPR) repeat protein
MIETTLKMAIFGFADKSRSGIGLFSVEDLMAESDLRPWGLVGRRREAQLKVFANKRVLAAMKVPNRNKMLLALTMVLAIGSIATLGYRRALGRPSSLREIAVLAQNQQFKRASALLTDYLRAHPHDGQAHLLMAQLATEPSAARPELALDHLRLIRPTSMRQAALIKFLEGKAHFQRGRYDLAEMSWNLALKLDPIVPEAGWGLVDLLDKESRTEEAHRLGMKLHEVEPDPRDRVRILLEMCRLDIEVPDPLSQVPLFEPIVKEHPENLPLSITVGVALTRVNRSDDGLKILSEALRRHPDAPEAWDGWFTGLYNASDADKLAAEFAKLPKALLGDPRFAKHEGMVAQNVKDWPRAVRAYRRAFEYEPFNQGVCYRYRFVLRQAGETAEYDRIDRFYKTYQSAYRQMRRSYYGKRQPDTGQIVETKDASDTRGVYYEVVEVKTLGLRPHPELYQRLADLREKMGRYDEARAWHRLVLRDFPQNALSLAALKRLQ